MNPERTPEWYKANGWEPIPTDHGTIWMKRPSPFLTRKPVMKSIALAITLSILAILIATYNLGYQQGYANGQKSVAYFQP